MPPRFGDWRRRAICSLHSTRASSVCRRYWSSGNANRGIKRSGWLASLAISVASTPIGGGGAAHGGKGSLRAAPRPPTRAAPRFALTARQELGGVHFALSTARCLQVPMAPLRYVRSVLDRSAQMRQLI